MNDSTRKPTTEDLLAHRDGELVDVELVEQIRNDLPSAVRARRLELIRQDLESLPDVQPDPELWAVIQGRAAGTVTRLPERRKKRWQLQYPLATAATVFFAVLSASIVLGPDLVPSETGGPQLAQEDVSSARESLATLVDRSQALEAVARMPVVRAAEEQDASRQTLLYRIAELDAEINGLIEQDSLDPKLKEQLFRQRVELLETLLAIQRDQLMQSAELY